MHEILPPKTAECMTKTSDPARKVHGSMDATVTPHQALRKSKGQPEGMCLAHPASSAEASCCCRVSCGCMSLQAVQRRLRRETCQSLSLTS